MILLFPDPDTVRLALTSGLVPADVTLAPAAVSTDAHGRLYVEPKAGLSKTTAKVLDRLGVKGSKRHGGEPVREVGSWVELVPLAREAGTPEVASGAAVLFELPTADDLPAIVTEMLRLGNDRQGFRWFAADGEPEAKRVLLRVIGPPYYTLLRALDRPAGSGVRAYLERAPRVWVEIGWTHPLAAQVKVAEGQFALLTPPANWRFVDDAPFQDVYDLAQFPLPAAPAAWEPAAAPEPVTVPLRLTAGNAADAAELWVLRDDPVGQLDTLVRDADERLVQRLMFAVAKTADGSPVAVLRTRPSKLPPPALPLENAVAFKPYWKLPNLFLPVGRRLHPTLRRDAVRRLLADDPDRVVWLYPDGKTGFTPENVPDAAFRSLEDWVDYVIESEQAPLAAWIGATRFDFEHFVCADVGGPKPKPDRPDREPQAKDEAPTAPAAKPDTGKPKLTRTKPAKPDAATHVPPPPEAVAPNEWKLRAKELEDRFLAVEGSLDDPERVALWPALAAAYTGAGDATSDAAVCWLNALWEPQDPPHAQAAAWARAEFPQLTGTVTAPDLDARLRASNPAVADARAVVAGFLAAASDSPVPSWLPSRLPAVQKYLDAHEGVLPVGAAGRAAVRLARLAGGDPLGLARARDRLLERLLTEGLRAERDLPGFLRFAGHRDADRLRLVREQVRNLHAVVVAWVKAQAVSPPSRPVGTDPLLRNVPYIDLMFAFAFAQLGEADTARELLVGAKRALVREHRPKADISQYNELVADITDRFLFHAFNYRVEQALAGKPHAGGLSPDLRAEFDAIRRKGGQAEHAIQGPNQKNNPFWQSEYLIERMQKEFRLLEPNEIPGTYTSASKYDNQFDTDVANLPQVAEPNRLANEIRRLFREGRPGRDPKDSQTRVVHKALALAHRVGEAFTLEVLGWVPGLLVPNPIRIGNPPTSREAATLRGELVERSIVLAAHYGRADLVKQYARRFTDLLRAEPEVTRFPLVNAAAGRALRNLRRLGLRDEIDYFLTEVGAVIYQGTDLPGLRARHAEGKIVRWADVLVTLANLAAGWLAFGLADRAAPMLALIRTELLRPGQSPFLPQEYTAVACGYVRALGSGPAEKGLPAITQLLAEMPAGRITNKHTTAPFYSRLHLSVVEEVVWALVSDEFALGPTGRKWLDDDEYLVRKRVHADLRRERDRAGV
jgi:hypothetical protein